MTLALASDVGACWSQFFTLKNLLSVLLPPATMPPPLDSARRMLLVSASAYVVHTIMAAVTITVTPLLESIPYHTSALSGHAWVMELLDGHPDRIKNELGMRKHVFHALVAALRASRLQDSRHLSLNQKVAIFLYMSVTGMRIRNVGEHFQHANETISK